MIEGLIVLGVVSGVLLFFLIREAFRHAKTQDSMSVMGKKYNKSIQRNEQLTTMFLSDKALHSTRLTYDDNHSFHIQYEVEILELTKTKAKIKTLDFYTDDGKMSDPKHKNNLMNYMDGKWVNLNSVEFILDGDGAKRELRLSKLLDNE